MRCGGVAIAALLVVACNGAAPARPELIDPGIALPRIGTVGELPDSTPHVLSIRADGTLAYDQQAATEEGLSARLSEYVRRTGREMQSVPRPMYVSDESVLLAVDERVPWGAAVRVWEDCVNAGLVRLWFAVVSESDGELGAIGIHPPDLESGSFPIESKAQQAAVRLVVGVDAAGSGAGQRSQSLYSALRTRAPSPEGLYAVWLDIPAWLPTGDALQLLDVAIRAGATHVQHVSSGEFGRVIRRSSFADLVHQRTESSYSFTIDGVVVEEPMVGMPPKYRVHRVLVIPSPWYWP